MIPHEPEERRFMGKVREALAAGRPSYGSWVTLDSALGAEVMGKAGFDWLILDCQHGAVHVGNLLSLIQAVELGGTRAIVRVGWNDESQIMRALDLGAYGVIVPMVSTPEEARRAAAAVCYPPAGIRSFGKVRSYYTAVGQDEPEPLCLVMIETAEAMQNLDEIAATPGVDGLFVGPMDLAISLGLGPAMPMTAEVLAAAGDVIAVCRKHGKISGSATLGADNARQLVEMGLTFVPLGNDTGFIRRGATAQLANAQGWAAR
jgi:4-hydroxy-2-oxoheptanedioate aldolase